MKKLILDTHKIEELVTETNKLLSKNYSTQDDAVFGAFARAHMRDLTEAIIIVSQKLQDLLNTKNK